MTNRTDKQHVATNQAPAAIGPYSQAAVAGDFVFVSGQLGVDPGTGEFKGESAAEQAEQALQNLRAVLEAAGASMQGLVQVTVYLADMADFAEVNAVYERLVPAPYPARVCVQAAALPKNARIEIAAVAVRG